MFAATVNIKAEVFVVDNNSSDGCPQMVSQEFPQCKLIANKNNPGFAVANNQAIKQAAGKYILILNPDTIIAENTLIKIMEYMNLQPKMGGLGIRMLDGSGAFLPESKRGIPSPWVSFSKMSGLSGIFPHSKLFSEYHKGYLSEKKNNRVEILAGAFMCFRSDVLDEIGLLDEDFFMYGEDIDLSYRSIQAGYYNSYFSDSSIIHFKGETTVKDKSYVNRFYKAMIQFAEKHFQRSYGLLLKLFIFLGVYLFKIVFFFKHSFLTTSEISEQEPNRITLLNSYLPEEDLIKTIKARFNLEIIEDINQLTSGTLLFVINKMTFAQMIEVMDVFKDRFTYRFLDEDHKIIIGSDNKYTKGQVITL